MPSTGTKSNLRPVFLCLFLIHAFLLFFDYGRMPAVPVLGDEVIINDPSISLALGHGFRAESLAGSHIAIDQYYGHFPPVYQLLAALVFRIGGISAYTLRLTSALSDLACMAVFLLALGALVRWRLAERATIVPIAIFGTLNAVFISMNRIARADSTVIFFGLLGLFTVIAALYRDSESGQQITALPARGFALLLLGALSIGLCLATHLEGMLVAAIAVCLILFAPTASLLQRIAACITMPITFIIIWCATLGKNSLAGWQQMHTITYLDSRIAPGLLREWSLLTREHAYRAEGPYLVMFIEAVFLLVCIPMLALWMYRRSAASEPTSLLRPRLAYALGCGCVLDLLQLHFVLPGSARRFGMMLPALLFCLAIVLPKLQPFSRRLLIATSSIFALASFFVLAAYFRADLHHDVRYDPRRFDYIADHVAATLPPGGHIVTSRTLWLAFRERGIPATIFYEPGFDGLTPFRNFPADSLDRFDTVVLVGTVEDDQKFLPQASKNRTRTDYRVGNTLEPQVVQVFERKH